MKDVGYILITSSSVVWALKWIVRLCQDEMWCEISFFQHNTIYVRGLFGLVH